MAMLNNQMVCGYIYMGIGQKPVPPTSKTAGAVLDVHLFKYATTLVSHGKPPLLMVKST
jgi:hypothetical protein